MVAMVTSPIVRGLRRVSGVLAILAVVVVFASLNLTTTSENLLLVATVAAVAFGIPAAATFLLAMWLDEQSDGEPQFEDERGANDDQADRPPFMAPLRSYAIAVVCVALAWGIRHVLDPYMLAYLPFPTFFLAVAITGWLCGFGPAVLAIVLSTALARYFYMSPLHELGVENVLTAVSICTFVIVSLVLAVVTAALHSALRRIKQLTALTKPAGSARRSLPTPIDARSIRLAQSRQET